MKVPRFDIFSGTEKNAQWIEVVEGWEAASRRMEFYAANCPGKYFLFDCSGHTIACNIDTSPSSSPPCEEMKLLGD
jgi:hypothetical protein